MSSSLNEYRREKTDEWATITRQTLRGCHLRMGTKKEVASALVATFASRLVAGYGGIQSALVVYLRNKNTHPFTK